jgi:hypothetical protein
MVILPAGRDRVDQLTAASNNANQVTVLRGSGKLLVTGTKLLFWKGSQIPKLRDSTGNREGVTW